MGAYKNRFVADFVPEGHRLIGEKELIKKGDWFWSNGYYHLVHDFLIGTRTRLPVVRKIHEPTKTNNSIMQFGAS